MSPAPWHIECRVGAECRPAEASPYTPAEHPLRGLAIDDELALVAVITCTTKLAAEGILWHLHEQNGATMVVLLDRITHEFVAACARPIPPEQNHA